MKKRLLVAFCGLVACLAPPAFASDSCTNAKVESAFTLLAVKERPTTFVIAERADKIKDMTATLATSKLRDDDTYLVKRAGTTSDSALERPRIISAKNDDLITANGVEIILKI